MIKQVKKKLTLIDNVKDIWKFATFQISVLIMALESLQAFTGMMPDNVANTITSLLVFALPFARAIKLKTKDE